MYRLEISFQSTHHIYIGIQRGMPMERDLTIKTLFETRFNRT